MDGETIICLGTRVWHSLWRNTQQVISRLATRNRVLYFEPGRNPDLPPGAEMWHNRRHFFHLHLQRLHENLIVVPTPSSLPYARAKLPRPVLRWTVPLVATLNARILARHVRWVMKELRVEAPILWLYEPRHLHLVGEFGEKLVCYYNYDEMADFAGNERLRDVLRDYDDRLCRRSDVVFASSRGQWERRRRLNEHTYFIPNAVDFDLFKQALDTQTAIPPEVAELPRPIIGYVGWLGYQIDVELLLRVAERYRQGSLVLVGPDHLPAGEATRRLRMLPNVHFLGRKELPSLPGYLKAIDVALIPYVVRGHTLTAFPLKLHEYLAAGRAIVATSLPELRPYAELVRLANTHEEFVGQVDEAAHDYTAPAVEARVALARTNTWDERVGRIHRILDRRLAAKGGGQLEADVHFVDEVRSPR